MTNAISVSIYCLLWFLFYNEKVAKFFDLLNTKHNKRFYQYITRQVGEHTKPILDFCGKGTTFSRIMQEIGLKKTLIQRYYKCFFHHISLKFSRQFLHIPTIFTTFALVFKATRVSY